MRRTLLLLVVALIAAGCPSTATFDYQNIKIDTKSVINAAALGSGDVFEVRVHHHNDMSGIFRVGPNGEIDFPLVGRVTVGGLTPSQISALIQQKLQDGYLKRPFVTVYVKEFNSKKIFVLGQVSKPGLFTFEESMSIVQAIALAGGFTAAAEKNFAIVTRSESGVEKRIPVPVEKIVSDGGAKNFLLRPGDIIFVPETVL